MDESLLIAAICHKREHYDALTRIGYDAQDFQEAARCLVNSAGEQYRRDADAETVDRTVLGTQVERKFGAGSMADSVMGYYDRLPDDVSAVNIIEEYRLLRLQRVSTTLATLLATGNHSDETMEELVRYKQLIGNERGEEFKARLDIDDFGDDGEDRIPVYPACLSEFIGGGVLPGHNITVYGRPESGKSLFALNFAAEACRQGYRVLYVANEEPAQDITKRFMSRLANIDIERLREKEMLRKAFVRTAADYRNFTLLHKGGCTARDIQQHASRIRPDIVIVDQIKNLRTGGDGENRALQLDRLAQQVREIGIQQGCVTVSITQAGDSAEQKRVLQMNDVEWSNTGIPGAADLMIGLGVDAELQATNKRFLSICKNKANGAHGSFPVWVDPKRTAFMSKCPMKKL